MTDDEIKVIAETKARADAIALKLTTDQGRQYVDACAPTIAKEVASVIRILDQAGYAVIEKGPVAQALKVYEDAARSHTDRTTYDTKARQLAAAGKILADCLLTALTEKGST